MSENEEQLLNKFLKDQSVVNIVREEKEVMIEFDNGMRLYINSNSTIELSLTEK